MRQPVGDTRRFRQSSTLIPLPAPVGGWNTADGLANMPALDAVTMDNFVPEESGVFLRGGDTLFATGMSGAVETLFEFVSPTANQLIAASDGNVYNITSGTPASLGTGFTNARWQVANYNGNTFMANGADTVQDYNGSTLGNSTFSGVTLSTLINVAAVRDRVWFVQEDTATAWYGPVAGVTGALTSFNLGEVSREGYLVAVGQWSRDAGNGMDDFTVFVMSRGDVLVYEGDPASTFSRVGFYKAPPPLGLRCTINIGGELILLTEGGYFTLTDIMQGQVRPQDALSAKIRSAVSDAYGDSGAAWGWEPVLSDSSRKLVVNVPGNNGTDFDQHVFNTIAKAWGKWQQRNCFTMANYAGDLYGGFRGGEVFKLESGNIDISRADTWEEINTNWEDITALWESRVGKNIEGYCVQAFNDFKEYGMYTSNKRVEMLQPFIEGSGNITCSVSVLTDYRVVPIASNLNTLSPSGKLWEEWSDVLWENWTLDWDSNIGGISTLNISANASGYSFAVALDANTDQSIKWYNTNLTVKPGGII